MNCTAFCVYFERFCKQRLGRKLLFPKTFKVKGKIVMQEDRLFKVNANTKVEVM